MIRNKKHDLLTISMLIGACVTLMIASFASFAQKAERISGSVLRLHVMANSDSQDDQKLKYSVRDFIIAGGYFNGMLTLDEARQVSLDEIKADTNAFIKAQGYDYNADVSLANMYFTTHVYENITMPAGYYDALRVIIGTGEGQNWWCVVFPPLCLPAVTKSSEPFFSAEAASIIENNDGRRIEVRFAVYEWFTRRRR